MSDYSELKRLAESCKGWDNMISCWPDQEQDGDADINWIVGHVGEDGDKYPVLELNTVQYDAPDDAEKLARFYAGANPAAVLALIAENERLAEDLGKTELRALKFIHQCSAHVDLYRELRTERDHLKAENKALRKDAERYRWMRSSFVRNCKHSLVWYLPMMTPLTAEGLDENIDAAMSRGEQE